MYSEPQLQQILLPLLETPHWPDGIFPTGTAGAIELIADEEGKRLVIKTMADEDFSPVMAAAERFLATDPDDGKEEKFLASFRGALFEQAANCYTASFLGSRGLLLPINEVFMVFEKTYPERQPIFDNFGLNSGIAGVRLPDALVLERRRNAVFITAFCEHSLNGQSLKKKAGYYGFEKPGNGFVINSHLTRREELKRNLVQYLKEFYPELPGRVLFDSQFGVYYGMPRWEEENGHNTVLRTTPRDRVLIVPVTHAEISGVAAGIISDLAVYLLRGNSFARIHLNNTHPG